nr:hypothetical protein F19B2.2 - Caenorhabditis elegans [Caenorhabditis elegans]
MVQVVYTLFATTLIIICIGFLFGFSLNYSTYIQNSKSTFLILFILSIWWLLSIIIQVFYILIILLAIEKFAIYFFPSTEKFVISAQKYQIKYVKGFYLITYICFNITFMLSALLYVPIMISLGKFSYLISAQRNNPQKYIFWQTFNILIFKLVALEPFEDLVLSQMFGDIIIIPQVIQISYLSCNKRNMDTLLKSFSGIKFVRLVFNIQETTSVAPQTVPATHF